MFLLLALVFLHLFLSAPPPPPPPQTTVTTSGPDIIFYLLNTHWDLTIATKLAGRRQCAYLDGRAWRGK